MFATAFRRHSPRRVGCQQGEFATVEYQNRTGTLLCTYPVQGTGTGTAVEGTGGPFTVLIHV